MPSFAIDHKKLYLPVSLLVILVFCLSWPARAADYTVPGTPYGTLEALRQAGVLASGDTIIMEGSDSSLTDYFNFGANAVTITGSGIITPNAPVTRFAENSSGTITIKGTEAGLVFSGFNSTGAGGAIRNDGGSVTISGGTNTFEKNNAEYGGVILNFIGDVTISGGTNIFENNSATVYGGAINNGDTITISGGTNTFKGNTANAAGGAICNGDGDITFSGGINTFENNMATLYGGAIINFIGHVTFSGGINTFTGNTAGVSGGAMVNGDTLIFSGGTNIFTGNTAGISGGAIYATSDVTITADTGDTTFQGNTANNRPNAIYMDGTGTTLTLNAHAQRGIFFYDPVHMAGAGTLAINTDPSHTGTVLFGSYLSAIGGNITVSHGTLYLASGASFGVSGNANNVSLEAGANLLFDAASYPKQALFDFSGASGASFQANGATLGLVSDRQLTSFVNTPYLIANGISDADRASAHLLPGAYISGFDKSKSGQYWALTSYTSPYQGVIDKWRNLGNAVPTLQTLLSDRLLVSDAAFAAIAGDLPSTTPDQIVNQARASLDSASSMSRAALRMAFKEPKMRQRFWGALPNTAQATPPGAGDVLAEASGTTTKSAWGLRTWGGYTGSFTSSQSHGGYHGYDQYMNGFLLGVNADSPDSRYSVGAYGGYSSGRTDTRGANSTVDSKAAHFGLLARLAPLPNLPGLAFTVDGGYTRFNHESKRSPHGAGRSDADFNQDVWSVGLGVEYEIALEQIAITPFAALRYAHLNQESVRESGGLTSTRVGSVQGDSLVSSLGLEASWNVVFESGVVSPFVSAAWSHEYGDTRFEGSSRYDLPAGHFAGTGSTPGFAVKTAKVDRDSANLGAGVRALFDLDSGNQWGVNVLYNLDMSEHRKAHSVNAQLEFRF